MKHSVAILFITLTACVTEPAVDMTQQAVTEDVADDEIGAACTSDPAEALTMIESAFGTGSPEHVAGVNCWREYDRDMNKCDADYNRCLALPPRVRPNCGMQHFDCWMMASRNYWSCIFYRSRWWCPSTWFGHTAGDSTQDW